MSFSTHTRDFASNWLQRFGHALGTGLLVSMLTLISPVASWGANTTRIADKNLVAMQTAYARNQTQRLNALLPTLKGHPLESLGAYWTLKANLEEASPASIQAFLKRWSGTYWEDRLRNDWMLQLIDREDWVTLIDAHTGYRMRDDDQITCGLWRAHRRVDQTNTVTNEAIIDLWFNEAPGNRRCQQAVGDLVAEQQISTDVLWARARQGAEIESRSTMLGALTLIDKAAELPGKTLFRQPYLWLERSGANAPSADWITLALIRLATTDSRYFETAFARWTSTLDTAQRQWVEAVVAVRAAWRAEPDAHPRFKAIDNQYLTDRQREWKVRTALRVQDWDMARDTINSMRADQQQANSWRYWLARAHIGATPIASDQLAHAQAILRQIAKDDDYYGLLARHTLGQSIAVHDTRPKPSKADLRRVGADPNIRAALVAFKLGLESEASRQWTYAVALHQPGGMNDRDLLAAAEIACQAGWWNRCIHAGTRMTTTPSFMHSYPQPFEVDILAQAKDLAIHPALIFGLIRQESRFNVRARSHAGAYGLMQVMPSTALWTAKKIGLQRFSPKQLGEHQTNLKVGSHYLKILMDKFEHNVPLATAAYNAGPRRANRWRPSAETGTMEAAVWIELIPFSETRQYVQNVIANHAIYASLQTKTAFDLASLLGPISPVGGVDSEDDTP